MKRAVQLSLLALFFIPFAGACKKTNRPLASQSSHSSALEEFRKLPDAEKKLMSFVDANADPFPTDVFDVEAPKIEVTRIDGSRFDLNVEHRGTTKLAIYSTPPAEIMELDGKSTHVTVAELLVAKGSTKVRKRRTSVVYGPMGWGKDPERIQWNWKQTEESGDDLQKYDARGPRIGWATAEQLKINIEGTSSTLPEVLIKGTPKYLRAVEQNPKLARPGERAQEEEAERFDRLLDALPRKSQ